MAQNNQSTRALALARRKAMSSGGKAAVANAGRVRVVAEVKPQTPAAPAPQAAKPQSSPAVSPRPVVRQQAAAVTRTTNPTRELSLARRKALSSKGKTAQSGGDRTRTADMVKTAQANTASQSGTVKQDCGCGCGGRKPTETSTAEIASVTPSHSVTAARANRAPGGKKQRRPEIANNPSKLAALARRKALSSRGKAGLSNGGLSQAQTARAANPELSGRELAQALRDQRSRLGKSGQKASRPSGKVRSKAAKENGPAKDAPWKVGASETSYGQTVTGTMVGRKQNTTGNDQSTCRTVTGTEYMGAEIFREFCQTEPPKTPLRSGVSATQGGNTVTGNKVGRSNKVTGDEPGTCTRVTGTEYLDAKQQQTYCGTTPEKPAPQVTEQTRKGKVVTGNNVAVNTKVTGGEAGANRELTGAQYVQNQTREAPPKVGISTTLSGRRVTGTEVGRAQKMTGDEAGSCRLVTGDEYLSLEQFQSFCNTTPAPQERKVGVSATSGGKQVTGTMNGRGTRVTGNEAGTCKAVTGTPYAGTEQFDDYCEAPQLKRAAARTSPVSGRAAAAMTGIQPSVGGKMTGDARGACETVSGTPYISLVQQAELCPAQAAALDSPDFPQALADAEWGQFSVSAPSHAAQTGVDHSAVTGTRYEQGHITGPFGMATGKVTGTEEARFSKHTAVEVAPVEAEDDELVSGRIKSRITGEGMDAGAKITGDDWARGERVTGTEGTSAVRRNETRRGAGMSAMAFTQRSSKVENEAPKPVSRVTGASGNTLNGALITYSGGARG